MDVYDVIRELIKRLLTANERDELLALLDQLQADSQQKGSKSGSSKQ